MNPEMWKNERGGPPPEFVMHIMMWAYAFGVVVIVIASVLNLLSGIFLRQRRHRMFALVIGGLNCLQMPLGTILGVFTIIILSRDSVRSLYESSSPKS